MIKIYQIASNNMRDKGGFSSNQHRGSLQDRANLASKWAASFPFRGIKQQGLLLTCNNKRRTSFRSRLSWEKLALRLIAWTALRASDSTIFNLKPPPCAKIKLCRIAKHSAIYGSKQPFYTLQCFCVTKLFS